MASTKAQGKESDPASADLNIINPDTATLDVAGITCRVSRIRMRELLLAARVLTAGIGSNLSRVNFDEMGKEDVAGLFLMAVPDAGDEVCDLIAQVVQPVAKLSKTQQASLDAELSNPDPDVALDVIGVLVEQEADTFAALVGKATAVFTAAQAKATATASKTA